MPLSHFTTPDLWRLYNSLPPEVRELADKNYALLRADPAHPSLHFKEAKVGVWSARVGRHYRVLAFAEEDGYYWFWIGSHAEYDQLLTHM